MFSLLSSQLFYNQPVFIEKVSLREPRVFKVPQPKKGRLQPPGLVYPRSLLLNGMHIHLAQKPCTPSRGRPAQMRWTQAGTAVTETPSAGHGYRHCRVRIRLSWAATSLPSLCPICSLWPGAGFTEGPGWCRGEPGLLLNEGNECRAKGLGYTP